MGGGEHHQIALPLFARALEIRKTVLGPTHPDTAASLNNLAVLHKTMGEHAKALPLYVRALEIREAALGPTHPDTALSIWNLALLHKNKLGNYQEAITLFERLQSPDMRLPHGLFLETIGRALTDCRGASGTQS